MATFIAVEKVCPICKGGTDVPAVGCYRCGGLGTYLAARVADGAGERVLDLPPAVIRDKVQNITAHNFPPFRLLYIDCPWFYNARNNEGTRFGIGPGYKFMKEAELAALPIGDLCADSAMLFLWATGPCLDQAFRVMSAWGFSYSTIAFAWVKLNRGAGELVDQTSFMDSSPAMLDQATFFGTGFYTASNVELVLLGRKGRAFKHPEGCKASQVVYAPVGIHSKKPAEVARRIEWMYPHALPRLELFAREARPGWYAYGDEVE